MDSHWRRTTSFLQSIMGNLCPSVCTWNTSTKTVFLQRWTSSRRVTINQLRLIIFKKINVLIQFLPPVVDLLLSLGSMFCCTIEHLPNFNSWPHIWLWNILLYRGAHGRLGDRPNHHPPSLQWFSQKCVAVHSNLHFSPCSKSFSLSRCNFACHAAVFLLERRGFLFQTLLYPFF